MRGLPTALSEDLEASTIVARNVMAALHPVLACVVAIPHDSIRESPQYPVNLAHTRSAKIGMLFGSVTI